MQVESNVLFVSQEAVSRMALEIVPDLFDRVEFRRIAWESLQVKPRKCLADSLDGWSLVDSASIPEENDVTAQVTQQHAQELGHLNGVEVVLPKLDVQAHPGALGRNRKRRHGGDPIVPIVVP
jgi:hypothetical protein